MKVPDAVLKEFVRESNMIEQEPTEPGHPLYDDHLIVTKMVAGVPIYFRSRPLEIHKRLMASQPLKFPGELRQVDVLVGGKIKMSAVEVRQEWKPLLDLANAAVSRGSLGQTEDNEKFCWDMHHYFEHIHPFWDGNGRTGRLWLNALRLCFGLPWLTVRFEERFAYYRSIEEWEANNEPLHEAPRHR